MKLSENLKRIRKENNLSQEQLAEKLNVSRQAVSKWESGQSYPEMEKVLLICKLFNYNMDELMNENVKEVNETQESKNNFNKYIEDFFSYITKTVDMFSCMKFRQKIKCIFEQVFVILFLFIVFFIIGCIGSSLLSNIFSGIRSEIIYTIRNVIETIFVVFALVFGTMIFLHIFKIRYLDYFEIVKEKTYEDNYKNLENKIEISPIENTKTYENKFEFNSENNHKTFENNTEINSTDKAQINEIAIPKDKKIFLEKKMEKIIIRDPVHSESKFLTGIMKIILWFIKFIIGCFSIPFVVSFVGIITLLVLSFMFIKTGILFFGALFTLLATLGINYIILSGVYDFITSKKLKKSRTFILFLSSLISAGLGIGMICIGITNFNYIENSNSINTVEDTYNFEMTNNLSINCWSNSIEYIETDSNEIKVLIKHSPFFTSDYYSENENITLYCSQDESKIFELIRTIISDINSKEIKDYYSIPSIRIYTSKDNIEKLQQSTSDRQNTIENFQNEIEIKENTINNLENELQTAQIEISNLKSELENKQTEIEILQNQI